jgi:hypothetical protein
MRQPFRIDAGHEAAQPGAEQDAGEDHGQREVGAEEAAEHVLVFLIGALKKKCCMSYSKSCCTERPIMAAITITPSEPRKLVVNISERGESISWLPP